VFTEHLGHSHVTYAVVDKSLDGSYCLHCLKQKQFVDGVGYLLQEIYGIENKNTERRKVLHPSLQLWCLVKSYSCTYAGWAKNGWFL